MRRKGNEQLAKSHAAPDAKKTEEKWNRSAWKSQSWDQLAEILINCNCN